MRQSLQRSRRANPHPFMWEIPAAAVAGAVLLLVLGVHLACGVANFLAGGGLVFTSRSQLFSSLPGLLGGDGAAGLAKVTHPASASALWTWMVVVEALMVVAIGIATKIGVDRWGPGRMQGMATREEAERLLGRSRLRKVAPVVRPDLYGKPRSRP